MKHLFTIILLIASFQISFSQNNKPLTGKWTEIRNETDNGSIFYVDTTLHTIRKTIPWIELDFSIPDTVLAAETRTPFVEPTPAKLYNEGNKTSFSFDKYRQHFSLAIVKQEQDILIMNCDAAGQFSKRYFMKKSKIETLSQREKDSLIGVWSQDDPAYETLLNKVNTRYFKMAEQMPQYPFWGNKDLRSELVDSIKSILKANNIEFVNPTKITAVAELNGRLSNLMIEGNDNKVLLDKIRQILNKFPRWKPANQNGVPVRCMTGLLLTD